MTAAICSSLRYHRDLLSSGQFVDIPGPAGAGQYTVSWYNPTQYKDGSAFSGGYVAVWDYGTTKIPATGAYPYRKYFITGTNQTGNVTGLQTGTYYGRLWFITTDTLQSGDPTTSITKVAA